MTEEINTNPEKSTFDADRLVELLPQLTINQLRYLAICRDFPSKGEAAEAIGMKPNTIYKWPSIVDEAEMLMAGDGVLVAREIRRRAVPKAMAVKVAALDSDNEKIRQDAATEIIEWELGKAQNNVDITSAGKELKGYVMVSPDDWDNDATNTEA